MLENELMLIGYARVSTAEQNLTLQTDALNRTGCERIFEDHASGAKTDRAGLSEALKFARAGDTLVVWKLDRLGRSLPHLIETVKQLQKDGIGFRSVQESIDTTSPAGKLFFHMVGALAEFERDIIRERTNAGLASARARGRFGGRPRALDPKKAQMARALYDGGKSNVRDICMTLGISKATLYRHLNANAP